MEDEKEICEFCGGEDGKHELIETGALDHDGEYRYHTQKCPAVMEEVV